jgi:hypothetical protein
MDIMELCSITTNATSNNLSEQISALVNWISWPNYKCVHTRAQHLLACRSCEAYLPLLPSVSCVGVCAVVCASAGVTKPSCQVQTKIHLISQTLLVLCGDFQESILLSTHWKENRVANGHFVLKRLISNGTA